MRGQKSEPVTKAHTDIAGQDVSHRAFFCFPSDRYGKKGDYVLVMRLIQFIPVRQSTPNSQRSHNCPFRLLQTQMCCWIQVSFSRQINILCNLHNLFNTDPHCDPCFTSPFFCQQQNISSLKADLQPRQMIREPLQRRVTSKVYFRPIRRKSSVEDQFHDRESLWCDSEAQQSHS